MTITEILINQKSSDVISFALNISNQQTPSRFFNEISGNFGLSNRDLNSHQQTIISMVRLDRLNNLLCSIAAFFKFQLRFTVNACDRP